MYSLRTLVSTLIMDSFYALVFYYMFMCVSCFGLVDWLNDWLERPL